jgi:hypothetical protein
MECWQEIARSAYFIVSLSNSTLVLHATTVRQSNRYKYAMERFEIEGFVLNNAVEMTIQFVHCI